VEEVTKLSDDDLLTGLKKQHSKTKQEIEAYLIYFDETVRRFSAAQPRSEGGQFEHKDQPTLPEAFDAIGRNYETERKRASRYRNAKNTRLRRLNPPSFDEGEIVKDVNFAECVFISEPKAGKAEIAPVGGRLDDVTTVPANSLVRVRVKRIELNDLILCADDDKQYRYIGKGLLECLDISALIKQKQERDAAAIRERQEQTIANAKATVAGKARHNAGLREEITKRDHLLVTEKPGKHRKRSHKPKAARAEKPTDPKPKSKADLDKEKQKAEEKAKQKVQDDARRAEIEDRIRAVIAPFGVGVDGNDKSVFLGKQSADGNEVRLQQEPTS